MRSEDGDPMPDDVRRAIAQLAEVRRRAVYGSVFAAFMAGFMIGFLVFAR